MSDEAIHRYEQELADDPRSRAFAPLAEAYRKAGRLDDAINMARTGLEVHPGYSAGLVVLGRALYEKRELDVAAEVLQNAVSDNPENYLGQKFLGKVLMDKGENTGAMRALEAANFLSPEDEEVARLLDEVRSKATAPEKMAYEATEAEAGQKAQIVTYEQKPTTIDGIELPPLPEDISEESFTFSGGGTVDPADITPVQVEEEVASSEVEPPEVLMEELDQDDETATVIDEEEVEQTMEIESIDELGPEVAAFIQESEEVSVEAVDVPSDDLPISAQGAEDEFHIEAKVESLEAPSAGTADVPEYEIAPEPESEVTQEASPPIEAAADKTEDKPVPEPATGPELESPTDPAHAPLPEPAHDTMAVPSPEPAPVTPPQPSVQAPPEPVHGDEHQPEQFSTETLADLYAQQGLVDKAVGMYRQIMEKDPGNEAVMLKLQALGYSEAQEQNYGSAEEPADEVQNEGLSIDSNTDILSVLEGMLDSLERTKKT